MLLYTLFLIILGIFAFLVIAMFFHSIETWFLRAAEKNRNKKWTVDFHARQLGELLFDLANYRYGLTRHPQWAYRDWRREALQEAVSRAEEILKKYVAHLKSKPYGEAVIDVVRRVANKQTVGRIKNGGGCWGDDRYTTEDPDILAFYITDVKKMAELL